MKQIFDWLREQIRNRKSKDDFLEDRVWNHAMRVCVEIVDEAEAKWEAECCELLDELVLETPQYRHGVCAFRHEEECGGYESCEHCLVNAIKDLLVNPNSRFRKISEVE